MPSSRATKSSSCGASAISSSDSAFGASAPGAARAASSASRVNGTDFRVLAEDISRERVFGEANVRVSGRGRNAVLAAPYAPVMTFTNAEPAPHAS